MVGLGKETEGEGGDRVVAPGFEELVEGLGRRWVGGWVGGWVAEVYCIHKKVEENKAVGMRCCGLLEGGWVGR